MNRERQLKISKAALNALSIAAQRCTDAFNQFNFVIKNNNIDLPQNKVLKNEKPYYRMNDKY